MDVLILHGLANHRPSDHWQFWLAERLRERGHAVQYPGLPEPDAPRYDAWHAALGGLLARQAGESSIVVCHSLSCLLWCRAAAGLAPGVRPARLLLVAPPESAAVPESGADFRLATFDADAVRRSAGQIRLACSQDDPYNPPGAQASYGDPLGLHADVIAGAGHITPQDGYGPWPSVLAWCEDGERALGALDG